VTGSPPSRTGGGGHAVVIGAGLAGLAAARVLADHFARVTVVERDRLPAGPAFRKGVPQSRHLHILLAQGLVLLNCLFPGIEHELTSAGAVRVRWLTDVIWLTAGGWGSRFDAGLSLLSCSRDLVDWCIRRCLAATPSVQLREGCEVVGLVGDRLKEAVAGVTLRHRPRVAAMPEHEDLPADLVIDASGRDSHLPQWLTALGYPRPPETRVDPFLGYASRFYAPPAAFGGDWKVMLIQAKPPRCLRGGALFPVEGNRWLVTLSGASGDYPPTDEAGFLLFARSLRSPLLAEAIAGAVPLSPIHGYRRTENRRRHYERLAKWPDRLLVLGEALCAFNPVYAQGMTVGVQAAEVLSDALAVLRRQSPPCPGFVKRTQERLAQNDATAWLMATGEDFRYPATDGRRPALPIRLMHRYVGLVLEGAARDPKITKAFSEVVNFLAPPQSLLRPSIVFAALTGGMRRVRTSTPFAPSPSAAPRDIHPER
jgi:2-polyprenyl-6-methoxyphenol hydroxylase-like FAD-dependent oxidoreductase